jgi:peptidoglycan hydrolase-like protein with peptidoglycan-binding domain
MLTIVVASAVTVVGYAGAAAADPTPPAPGGVPGPVAAPAVPAGLPQGIEDLAAYTPQVSCDPAAKPGATALAKLLVATYPGSTTGIARACATDTSEHYEGRAIDWMVSIRKPAEAAEAQAVVDWLFAPDAQGRRFANARRLGVMYLIWNDRIWGAYASDSGWRPYSSCATRPEPGSDTACHRNHVHISLSWAGATARTSFWSGKVAAADYGPCRPSDLNWAPAYSAANPRPCPRYPSVPAPANAPAAVSALVRYSGITLGSGSAGAAVSAVQTVLGAQSDGRYGSGTQSAVAAFRAGHGLAAGSIVDADTWRALLVAADGLVKAGRTADRPASPPTSSSPPSSPSSSSASVTPALPVLRYGARGSAVVALQQAVKVTPASGWFGPTTLATVTRFQQAHRLQATGVVDAATWTALRAG